MSPNSGIITLLIFTIALLAVNLSKPRLAISEERVLDIVVVVIPKGTFFMGDPADAGSESGHYIRVDSFKMMVNEVTNRQFAAFVASTGYISDAEKLGGGFVFDQGRWRFISGARWQAPKGPGSTLPGLDGHPVVHVTQRDAAAFCAWAGMRLPREDEWEYAARGYDGRIYPWGHALPIEPDRPPRANIGTLECCAPSAADGFLFTSHVGIYPSGISPFGMLDMSGNVWEWTATPFPGHMGQVIVRGGGWGSDPMRAKVTTRSAHNVDKPLDMLGFRCAASNVKQQSKVK